MKPAFVLVHLLILASALPADASSPVVTTSRSSVSPTPANSVWVASKITDTASLTGASLTYTANIGSGTTTIPFTEKFGTTVIKPWNGASGTGANNPWSVIGAPNPFDLRTSANYVTSSTACGMQYNGASTHGSNNSITTTNSINTAGSSAYIEFYVKTTALVNSDGWSFQVDPSGTGTNFVTRISEFSGNVHAFQKYHYDLAASELVSNLKIRFQFTGGGTGSGTNQELIDLDQVTVSVTTGGPVPITISMFDDGAHGDGTAGDGVYGAQIPAQPVGTIVSYYVTATDSASLVTTDSTYSYTVRATATVPAILSTAQSPATVTATSAVWVTSNVTDQSALTAVQLVYDAGAGPVTIPMFDDGAHQDGTANDGTYGVQLPAFPTGTTVYYSVTAANDLGLSATDPAIVPSYRYSYTVQANQSIPQINTIPGGSYIMGDHFSTIDPNHPSDEQLHTVSINSFSIARFDITNEQYCNYLNSALSQGLIQVTNGLVYGVSGTTVYCETRQGQSALYGITYSGISWNGIIFSVLAGNQNMPMVGVRWEGALAYCNWLSTLEGFQTCYNLTTFSCDYTKNGYRLPTEAEWEYAANGGNTVTYYMYPWGNDPNTDGSYANTLGSGNPWATFATINQTGAVYPWTTPVGFYNGSLRLKSDFNWPGSQTSYQTSNGVNGYGLYDMSGDVWQWTNDIYAASYYPLSPTGNPTGPATGDLFGTPAAQYHTLRGGSYAQGASDARISNRDPAFFRQPLNNTYASIGFRVVLAPGSQLSSTSSALQITQLLANPSTFSATADYPTQNLGVITNTSSAQPGYTIVDPMLGKTTYLINNNGQVVNSWTSTYAPGRSCYLLPGGNIIRAGALTSSPVNTGGGEGGVIEERDWNRNLVWSYKCSGTNADGTAYEQHHDFCVLPNGDILMLVVEQKTYAQAIAAGFNPVLFDANLAAGGAIQMDSLVEVQASGTTGANIVWQWHFWDHLIQNYDSSKLNYGVVASHPELLNANCGQHTIQFFNHVNGINYNSTLDQVMLSARNQSEVYIIDHNTTTAQAASHSGGAHGKGGDFLYRWGNPANYGASGSEMLFQQHDTQWIPADRPGGGDILVFNNGENRPGGNYSSVDEFTPPVDANGNYALTTGSAYGPTKMTWTWTATPPSSFYNPDVGGAQRQPNGNTLICFGVKGEVWEITSNGQIVWDYQNPCTGGTMLYQGDSLPSDPHQTSGYLTALFRCERYSPDYAGFTGRTLTPGATLEQYRNVIELHNSGTSTLNLSGMYLTNNLSIPGVWQIGSGISITADGYLLFYADGQTSATTASGRHTSFTLSSTGGSIGLFDADGITGIDAVAYASGTLNIFSPIEAWRLQKFGTTANTGTASDTATPAGDGIPNLVKYALNLDPNTPSVVGVVTDATTGYLRMTVSKNPAATDVSFIPEINPDLTNSSGWTDAGIVLDQDSTTILQAHDEIPVNTGTRRFMRLKVTRP